METETWIERLLIDQLTRHDRRYKHDYAGVEQTTDDLATACGTTTLWEPTVEGRAEARAIREAYSAEVEALAESFSPDSDEFRRKIGPIARTYGILPSYFR